MKEGTPITRNTGRRRWVVGIVALICWAAVVASLITLGGKWFERLEPFLLAVLVGVIGIVVAGGAASVAEHLFRQLWPDSSENDESTLR